MTANPLQYRLREQWLEMRHDLFECRIATKSVASLSLRCPGGDTMWFGMLGDEQPALIEGRASASLAEAAVHTAVYACRGDAGALAWGVGRFGPLLGDFGGRMPCLFDEQARHLGRMPAMVADGAGLDAALRAQRNTVLMQGRPLCVGTTARRLVLNLALLEKCSQAYLCALATGAPVTALPWWVRRVAFGLLARDQRRAAAALARGELPEDSKGY